MPRNYVFNQGEFEIGLQQFFFFFGVQGDFRVAPNLEVGVKAFLGYALKLAERKRQYLKTNPPSTQRSRKLAAQELCGRPRDYSLALPCVDGPSDPFLPSLDTRQCQVIV